MKIDLIQTSSLKTKPDSKKNLVDTNDLLSKEILASLQNTFENLKSNSIYEGCLWLESNENLLSNKNKDHTKKYNPKSIVLVDLGMDTFGHEFSYEHPCVVLYNTYNKVFVVPCTSQAPRRDKSGKIYPEQLLGTTSNGFKKQTTILLTEAKFIDKSRIKSELGYIDNTLFNKIYNSVFELLFESKKYQINKLIQLHDDFKEKLEDSEKKVVSLEEELSIIKQENDLLRKELEPAKLASLGKIPD